MSIAPDPSYLMLQSDLARVQLESANLRMTLAVRETEIAALWDTLRKREIEIMALEGRAEIEGEQQGALIAELVAALTAVEWAGERLGSLVALSACPLCDTMKIDGHKPRCIVGLALAHAAAMMQEEAQP